MMHEIVDWHFVGVQRKKKVDWEKSSWMGEKCRDYQQGLLCGKM